MDTHLLRLAKRIRMDPSMKIYPVNNETEFQIPWHVIHGRVGTSGCTFAGKMDLETGRLRIDCAEEPAFWIEVDFGQCDFMRYAPDGLQGKAIVARLQAKYASSEASLSNEKTTHESHEETKDNINLKRDDTETVPPKNNEIGVLPKDRITP